MVTVFHGGEQQGDHRSDPQAAATTPASSTVFGTLYRGAALPYALSHHILLTISNQVQRFAHVGSFSNGFFARKSKSYPLDGLPSSGIADGSMGMASMAGLPLANHSRGRKMSDGDAMMVDGEHKERPSSGPLNQQPRYPIPARNSSDTGGINGHCSAISTADLCLTPTHSQCTPSPCSSTADFSVAVAGLPPRPPRPSSGRRLAGVSGAPLRPGSSSPSPSRSASCSATEIHMLPGILESGPHTPPPLPPLSIIGLPPGLPTMMQHAEEEEDGMPPSPSLCFMPECVRMGQFSDPGIRSYQEDVTCAVELGSPTGACLFAVCDGHGGKHVSESIAESITYAIQHRLDYVLSSGADAMGEILLDIEQSLPEEHGRVQGSTATVGLVVGGRLEVVHIGDSRMILGKEAAEPDAAGFHPVYAMAVTDDHNPENNELERNRILSASARIEHGGYVGGVLQVSRSIGDFQAKEFLMSQHQSEVILSTPDTVTIFLCERVKFAVAVTDGITSVMDDQMIVDQVVQYLNSAAQPNDPTYAARQLVEYAINVKGSEDNCSAVVVCFCSKPPDMPVRRRRLNLARRTADGLGGSGSSTPVASAGS